MKTYKNKNYTKRNYECTNIIFCETDNILNTENPEIWIEIESIDIANTTQLWQQNGVIYYGFL